MRLLRSFTPPPSACALRLRAIRPKVDLALAVAFRTIFAKQSLVSTLLMKWPSGARRDFRWIGLDWGRHGIRDHASKEARQHGLSSGLDAALLPRTRDAQC